MLCNFLHGGGTFTFFPHLAVEDVGKYQRQDGSQWDHYE